MPSDDLILRESDRLILLGQSKVEASAFNGNDKMKGRALSKDSSVHSLPSAAGTSRPFTLSSSSSSSGGNANNDGATSSDIRKVLVVNWTPRVSGMVRVN